MRRFVALLVPLVLGACESAPEPANSEAAPRTGAQSATDRGDAPATAEVRAALERYYADFSARAWEAFASHFHEGATMSTVWSPDPEAPPVLQVISVPEFVAQAPEGPGSQPIFEERMTGADIRVTGDLATAWVTYEARFGSPGEIMEWSGIDAFTLIRFEGAWRIVSLAYVAEG